MNRVCASAGECENGYVCGCSGSVYAYGCGENGCMCGCDVNGYACGYRNSTWRLEHWMRPVY